MDRFNIQYGDETYVINILYRNVKNIRIQVNADNIIQIISNKNIEVEYLEEFARSKIHWIYSKVKEFKNVELESDDLKFVSGESYRYLGRQYRIKIITSDEEKVALSRNYIEIRTQNKDSFTKKKKLFDSWLSNRCNKVFNDILLSSMNKFNKKIEIPDLKIRKMKNRWGSYSNNTITLNNKLIHKRKTDIEYVIVHELTHQFHPNHSAKFYELLSVILPDWRERKMYLDYR
jgi:predicted metal-dependent hydrolase